MIAEISSADKQKLDYLRAALGRNLDSRAKYDLLAFWARHPSGWSVRGALAPRTSATREEIELALRELVGAGIVEANHGQEISFYGLARMHPAYGAVLQLAKLTPKKRKYLMRVLGKSMPEAVPQSAL